MLYSERLLIHCILIFHGNPNAAQVTIMILNIWGHHYCGDWDGVNWCIKLRVGDYSIYYALSTGLYFVFQDSKS